jgi:L-ascorbate metabolism protein UlaG (beta-lactamase superfamily)
MWFPKSVLSYMILGSQTVFFIGDTALFDDMREIGKDYDIDAALVPVWGIGPYLRGDHMTPAQAAEALSMLSPRVAVPIHWGTIHPMGPWWKRRAFLHRPPHAFQLEATRRAPETEVRVLFPGENTLVGPEPVLAPDTSDVALPLQPQPALA